MIWALSFLNAGTVLRRRRDREDVQLRTTEAMWTRTALPKPTGRAAGRSRRLVSLREHAPPLPIRGWSAVRQTKSLPAGAASAARARASAPARARPAPAHRRLTGQTAKPGASGSRRRFMVFNKYPSAQPARSAVKKAADMAGDVGDAVSAGFVRTSTGRPREDVGAAAQDRRRDGTGRSPF